MKVIIFFFSFPAGFV